MTEGQINRRDFIRKLGAAGALVVATPWLSAFSEVAHTGNERCRLGIIGPGSRGTFLMGFLVKNPKAEIVAVCDIYQPSIDEALKIAPKAKVYRDYRELLADKSIDAVVIATPLDEHCHMVLDAFDAGKHVFCEKSIGYDMDQCLQIYRKHKETGRVFFSGQQRLFDPCYIKAMELVHTGAIGEIGAINAQWYRSDNLWRRPIPSPDMDRQINWRLYRDRSKGIMTELACHQLQVGTWALRQLPETVVGTGALTYWKDGREVYDNVHLIYRFADGRQMTYASVLFNKFYRVEEQIIGSKGNIEPEAGKYYMAEIPPAPAFLKLMNDWENKLFDNIPFAGTSWAPESPSKNKGEYITGGRHLMDGTSLTLDAFVEASITGKQPPRIAEEGYYASILALWGHEALMSGQVLEFPEKYKLDYLNHQTPKTPAL